MSPSIIALLVFACVFGAALLGLFLRSILPEHHFSADTKDAVKLAMGLVATMAALILGLLVASAKDVYDTEQNGVIQMAAKVAFLDRILANYGSETKETRELLLLSAERIVARMWPDKKSEPAQLDPSVGRTEHVLASIQELSPKNDLQTALKSQAWTTTMELGQLRWLEFEEQATALSTPLLCILTLWLAILFVSFGLFSPSNGTVVSTFLLAALSVSGAIFLILELDRPFDGIMQIPGTPLINTISHLGQ